MSRNFLLTNYFLTLVASEAVGGHWDSFYESTKVTSKRPPRSMEVEKKNWSTFSFLKNLGQFWPQTASEVNEGRKWKMTSFPIQKNFGQFWLFKIWGHLSNMCCCHLKWIIEIIFALFCTILPFSVELQVEEEGFLRRQKILMGSSQSAKQFACVAWWMILRLIRFAIMHYHKYLMTRLTSKMSMVYTHPEC